MASLFILLKKRPFERHYLYNYIVDIHKTKGEKRVAFNLLIDGSNLAHRMHSTLDLNNSEGESVSVLFGVIKNIHSLIKRFEPSKVVVCWDTSKSSMWRRKIYPDYKMNRKKNNGQEDEEGANRREDYERQRDLLQLALSWLPVYQVVVDELEADDIIYLLAKEAFNKKEDENIIVSTDKDLLQIIDERTVVWSPIKEVMVTKKGHEDGWEPFDVKVSSFEEFMGFPFEHFLEVKVLQGDTSDGIAGIPGIGEKTAITLLEKYGSINEMFKDEEEMRKSKRNAKIVDNPELIDSLRDIMDISKVSGIIDDPLNDIARGIIRPSEEYKKFWNFARDNDFKTIYLDYRLWCRPVEKMGINPINGYEIAVTKTKVKRKKRKPKTKAKI